MVVAVYKFDEEDYARVITPDGIDIKMDGKEQKERIKDMLKSVR